MNAVEIEQAITDLAEQPFDPARFPYAFLEPLGNKATTLKHLRLAAYNKSDLGGVPRDRGDGLQHDRRHGEDEAPGSNCRLHSAQVERGLLTGSQSARPRVPTLAERPPCHLRRA